MKFADSNAIGDFYTCASSLKEPARTKLQAVIRQYAQARLDLSAEANRSYFARRECSPDRANSA
jgi:hypothetical protein